MADDELAQSQRRHFGRRVSDLAGQNLVPEPGLGGWRPYNGGGMHDPADVTGGHYDHLHITVKDN